MQSTLLFLMPYYSRLKAHSQSASTWKAVAHSYCVNCSCPVIIIFNSWFTSWTLIDNGAFSSLLQPIPKPAVMNSLKRMDFKNTSTSYIRELLDSLLWLSVYGKVILLCIYMGFFFLMLMNLTQAVEADVHRTAWNNFRETLCILTIKKPLVCNPT